MASYKTPGVYIEEISKFPPSVAQVETAIPAFIGYTQKAKSAASEETDNLILTPTRITSLLEYTTYFGGAQPEKGIVVKLTDTNVNGRENRVISVPEPTVKSPYLMYYSLQMYFANGGGPCYIVSTGLYQDWSNSTTPPTPSRVELKAGLDTLKTQDEPTLIVFPDATNLPSDSELYSLYNDSLTQCHDMQDRFSIFDTYRDNLSSVDQFRNGISSDKDFIKYGATYFPFLKTILNYDYIDSDIQVEHISYSPGAIAKALTNLNDYAAVGNLPAKISAIRTLAPANSISGLLHDARLYITEVGANGFDVGGTYDFTATKLETFLTKIDDLTTKLSEVVDIKKSVNIDALAAKASVEEDVATQTAIQGALDAFNAFFEGANKIESVLKNLLDLVVKINKFKTEVNSPSAKKLLDGTGSTTINFMGELAKLVAYSPVTASYPDVSFAVTVDVFDTLSSLLGDIITEVTAASTLDVNNGEFNGRSLSVVQPMDNATYNLIKLEIAKRTVTVPSSGVMAGIYARVDKNNGVWKAPANVSVNYVIKPTLAVTHDQQADLNVHTTGKSINAIRSFTGKGTLVWGGRTLAGNDNEWRYISVRRFFNMVEESVKKATEQFVFEGNDANTWVRLRAMIENFLILQWRAGALTGAKPEQAFFVRIGLGETMTADDILNGYMNVEIGMAVVRPAEFIVLKFSHKMQEA